MSIFSSLADYGRAIRTASSHQGLNLLAATRSGVRAKTKYGIGPRFHSLFELGKRPDSAWADYLIDELLRIELRQINPPAAREVVNVDLRTLEKNILLTAQPQHQIPGALALKIAAINPALNYPQTVRPELVEGHCWHRASTSSARTGTVN